MRVARRPVALLAAGVLLVAALAAVPGSLAPSPAMAVEPTSRYVPVTPVRLADTRHAFGTTPAGRLAAGGTLTMAVTGRTEVAVPAGATAAVVGVVAIGTAGAAFLTVWPSDQPRPDASNINTDGPGRTVADLVTSRLSSNGQLSIYASAATDVAVDLFGYYVAASGSVAGGRTMPVTPTRAYDSRLGAGAFAPDQTRTVPLPASIVPSDATAAVLNLTVTGTLGAGFWSIFPTGSPPGPDGRPATSNLNVSGPGETRAVQAIVPITSARTVEVFSFSGGHAIVDVFGYVTGAQSPAATAGLFVPLPSPVRFADTRSPFNNPLGPWPQSLYPGWTLEVPILGRHGVPGAASLVAATTTYVQATGPGYLTAYPAGTPLPNVSVVNATSAGQTVANHTAIPVAVRGVSVFSSSGGHVLVDVAGYFTGAAQPSPLPPPTNEVPPGRTSCRAIVHLGDSTSVGLISPTVLPNPADRIDAQYARVGVTEQHLEISGARSIVETLPGQINAYEVARNLRAAGYRGCWVLALGTTDTANVAVGSSVGRATRIDRMMSVIGSEPVLWVNVKTLVTSGAWSNANMVLWNQALVQAQARYPNIKIYDWAAVVQSSWFGSDQVHYTPAGYRERARRIADALAATYPA